MCHSQCLEIRTTTLDYNYRNWWFLPLLRMDLWFPPEYTWFSGMNSKKIKVMCYKICLSEGSRRPNLDSYASTTRTFWLSHTDYFISPNNRQIINHIDTKSSKSTHYCLTSDGHCGWRTMLLPHSKTQMHWSCSTQIPSKDTLNMYSVPMQKSWHFKVHNLRKKEWFVNVRARRLQGLRRSSVWSVW